jgi:hypothetical protein
MPIDEITGTRDAAERFHRFFPADTRYKDRYIDLVALLSNKSAFTNVLEKLSGLIWDVYNESGIRSSPNRYTRSLMTLAQRLGLRNDLNIVLTDAADTEPFGKLIRDGHLWKDSFAPGHGEFSHSYQWLAAGHILWGGAPLDGIYKSVAGVKSIVPLFVKDDTFRLRTANLWEWMVDCTLYDRKYDALVDGAVEKFVKAQLRNYLSNRPTNSWFINSFLKAEDREFPLVIPSRLFAEWKATRETITNGDAVAARCEEKYAREIAGYQRRLAATYPKQNVLSSTFRNANTVSDTVRQRREPMWFISAYEHHRSTTLRTREDAALTTVMATRLANNNVQLPMGGGVGFGPIKAALDQAATGVTGPDYYKGVMAAARTPLRMTRTGLETGLKAGDKTFGRVDVGKAAVKMHYQAPEQQRQGWALRNDNDPRQTMYQKPVSEDPIEKDQRKASFHGRPGTINVKPGRALD